jgi:hypothetical protein
MKRPRLWVYVVALIALTGIFVPRAAQAGTVTVCANSTGGPLGINVVIDAFNWGQVGRIANGTNITRLLQPGDMIDLVSGNNRATLDPTALQAYWNTIVNNVPKTDTHVTAGQIGGKPSTGWLWVSAHVGGNANMNLTLTSSYITSMGSQSWFDVLYDYQTSNPGFAWSYGSTFHTYGVTGNLTIPQSVFMDGMYPTGRAVLGTTVDGTFYKWDYGKLSPNVGKTGGFAPGSKNLYNQYIQTQSDAADFTSWKSAITTLWASYNESYKNETGNVGQGWEFLGTGNRVAWGSTVPGDLVQFTLNDGTGNTVKLAEAERDMNWLCSVYSHAGSPGPFGIYIWWADNNYAQGELCHFLVDAGRTGATC